MYLVRISSNLIFFATILSVIICGVEANRISKTLCGLKTDGLIEHYGYESETHKIQTDDGYILTAFRCNSKKSTSKLKKSVLVQHGLLVSSDDFCISPPEQALAYVLADAGYDVWLLNSRGNFYSRNHISKNPDTSTSFWNFSWYEMGVYDQPAVIDYVLNTTKKSKVFYVGHSQGAASLLILLSEKPEYNEKIHAASLLAPAGFMSSRGVVNQLWGASASFANVIPNMEVLPRLNLGANLFDNICGPDYVLCNGLIDMVSGPSENQRDNTIMPAFLCHQPSGSWIKQIFHFGQSIQYGTFGKFANGPEIPKNFPFQKITAPLSVHISKYDALVYPIAVDKLIPTLNSLAYLQIINETKYNHADFMYGKHSASLVYSKVLTFFGQYN